MQSTEGAMPIVRSWLSLGLWLRNTHGNIAPPPSAAHPIPSPEGRGEFAFLLSVTQSISLLHCQQWT